MSLTYKQIWERYSQIEFKRRLYVKFLNEDGNYDNDYTEISIALLPEGSVNRVSQSLPNQSYKFGRVMINNVSLKVLSAYQEFASENVPGSIFAGRLRHWSIIKVVDALIDKYSDPENPEEIAVNTFIGLIDSATATTEEGYESVTLLDFLTVLAEHNVNEFTFTQTTLNDLVYEILNRPMFTKYFNVSNSTSYINAGFNTTDIDVTQYDDSVLEMLEDLAKGHSIFYINPDDNYFYFKEAVPTAAVQHEFLEQNNRKISISKYREGVDRQVTDWFWNDTDISSRRIPAAVNPRTSKFNVYGVTNDTVRQNLLDFVLTKTRDAKQRFSLKLPYYPIIKLLDRIIVQHFGQAPEDAARWGMFFWTTKATSDPNNAPRWRKPAGIKISADDEWMVTAITHDHTLTTTIECEKIL